MKKLKLWAVVFAVIVFSVICIRACNSELQPEHHEIQIPSFSLQAEIPVCEAVTVKYVVDGDTLAVADDSGKTYKVRLIGCNTPESVSPDESKNCEEGIVASQYTKSLLSKGDLVYLEYDQERFDKYERVLAYVWLSKPTKKADVDYIKQNMLNAKLLADGQAQCMFVGKNTKYQTEFLMIENNTVRN